MNSKEINKRILDTLSQLRQEIKNSIVLQETQTPAPITDPEYEIKNYPRLLQLARAGLVPEDSLSKLTNVLKDPKRFGVSPKTRDQLYDLMIKTLNYIVISDPAAWARFRAFLMNEQTTESRMLSSIRDYSTALQKNRLPIGEQEMDKIEKYKNLNEQVTRLLRKEEKETLQEQFHAAAEELVEALEDTQKLNTLLRTGLVDSGKIARIRTALKDPEKAMANTSLRSDLINMLMTLINVVTTNATAYSSVRKTLGKSEEPVVEELVGGQKKLDVNKNGKVDGADLAALRAGKKAEEDEDEEIEEELIGGQKKLDVNKNGKVDGEDLAALRAGKKKVKPLGNVKENTNLDEADGNPAPYGWNVEKSPSGRTIYVPKTKKEWEAESAAFHKKNPGHWERVKAFQKANPLNPDSDDEITGVDDHLPGGVGKKAREERQAAIKAHRRGRST